MEVRMLAARDLRPSGPDLALRLQFQRGRPKIRRGPRRVGLRLGHMLLILALFAALFVGLEKAYLLSLTSRALAVKGLDLSGATDRTEAAVRRILEASAGSVDPSPQKITVARQRRDPAAGFRSQRRWLARLLACWHAAWEQNRW